MKSTFNKYWILVVIGIFANIFIFMFMSKGLEHRVYEDIVTKQALADI